MFGALLSSPAAGRPSSDGAPAAIPRHPLGWGGQDSPLPRASEQGIFQYQLNCLYNIASCSDTADGDQQSHYSALTNSSSSRAL